MFDHLLRSLLLRAAKSESLASFVTHNAAARAMASRFVAGTTLEDALKAVKALNCQGISATLDCLGEHTNSRNDAYASRDMYADMLKRITQDNLTANVSLKLTQFGLEVDERLCHDLVASVVRQARECGNFVRIDMEDSAYTDRTLAMTQRMRRTSNHVGIVIQACLKRSERDLERLMAAKCRVRLCKGAYKEPPDIAFQKKHKVDEMFVLLASMLINDRNRHAIATHDERIIRFLQRVADAGDIPKGSFEFQMLYGIRTDLQKELVRDGYHVRVYVPFGERWFPYFMRRLAERPANLLFFIKHLFKA